MLMRVILLIAMLTHPSALGEKTYGVMVDAGSGGTRIHVFVWDPLQIPLQIERVDTNYSKGISPGISASIATQKDMDEYMLPLLEFAQSKIPPNRHASTPLYFKATAGLRMMSPQESLEVLEKVGTTFSESKFLFQKDWLKVISGTEEGLFNWITVNAIYGRLHVEPSMTLGALDLGGASTQISFVPEEVDSIRSALVTVHMFDRTYTLYDHSFLGFGVNEARKRMERDLPQRGTGLLVNPCLPKGYSRKTPSVVMEGDSDYASCLERTLELMKKKTDCGFNCSIAGLFQPPLPNILFNARDHYVRIVSFLGLVHNATIAQVNERAREICALDYSSYTSKYSMEPQNYCFEACYLVSLLRNGLGFDEHKTNIQFKDQINGYETSWTLGAMYFEIAKFHYTLPKDDRNLVDTVVATASVVGFAVVVVLVLGARKLSSIVPTKQKKK